MRTWRLLTVLLAAITLPAYAAALTIPGFEKSLLFKKFKLVDSDNWSLKVGGQNFLYNFQHPNGVDYLTIETGPSRSALKRMSVQFPSDLNVNRVSGRERELVLAALAFFAPKADKQAVMRYIDSQINTSYSGGSNSFPRKAFGALNVYAGRTQGTIIGFEIR